ncbi:MAG TPA: TRAP transporter small permease [Clostridiales bacterium]|nr:TRAP transporter small permease [Clostridiales bacterium]
MSKNKVISFLDKSEEISLVIMYSVMVLVIFLQVIMRYCFNNSLSWSEELGKFLFVWLSWIGISIGAKRGEHIKITLFTDKLPAKAAHVANIISEMILIGICAVTVYYGWSLVISQSGVHYAGIKISMAWGYLSVVIGCALMIIRSLISIADSVGMLSGRITREE